MACGPLINWALSFTSFAPGAWKRKVTVLSFLTSGELNHAEPGCEDNSGMNRNKRIIADNDFAKM
jgi:hypothetical protein